MKISVYRELKPPIFQGFQIDVISFDYKLYLHLLNSFNLPSQRDNIVLSELVSLVQLLKIFTGNHGGNLHYEFQ